jgi:hypothetical protein
VVRIRTHDNDITLPFNFNIRDAAHRTKLFRWRWRLQISLLLVLLHLHPQTPTPLTLAHSLSPPKSQLHPRLHRRCHRLEVPNLIPAMHPLHTSSLRCVPVIDRKILSYFHRPLLQRSTGHRRACCPHISSA